ncbi:MAG: hypothetical protein ILO68_05835, partial [Clostridia bacterium]|nr:hypothetical protein [Clostridia bacterium]
MGSKPEKGRSLIDVFCASCGAPAYFDIPGQYYNCAYCGSRTGIREALDLKQEFRSLNRERISKKADEFELFQSNCTGCGARVLFMENEASAVCGFCGRKLIRSDYLSRDDFPELIIPFRLTPEEAKNRLETWCVENSRKKEARLLKKKIGDLEGFYLPFVLVKGPCSCSVRRNGASRVYNCRSYLDHMFVATSKNVNNLVVNGTEPYNLDELRPFDFSFVAGHRLRVSDLDSDGEKKRISEELSAEYGDFACRTMETAETSVDPSIGGLMTMSVVLPAYYLRAGNVFAAVNGQTGRVAVEEQRVRKTLPWRVKPVFWSLLMAAVCFLAVYFFSKELEPALFVSGGLLSFFLIVFYSA